MSPPSTEPLTNPRRYHPGNESECRGSTPRSGRLSICCNQRLLAIGPRSASSSCIQSTLVKGQNPTTGLVCEFADLLNTTWVRLSLADGMPSSIAGLEDEIARWACLASETHPSTSIGSKKSGRWKNERGGFNKCEPASCVLR